LQYLQNEKSQRLKATMHKPTKASKETPAISSVELGDMIAQYQHLLVCLEADLSDRCRLGSRSAKDYKKRIKRLKAVEAEIEALKKIAFVGQKSPDTEPDVGLPFFEDCNPAEQEAYDHSLMEKEIELLRIEQHTKKTHNWLRAAIEGKTGSLLLTFRLSGLRRFIHTYKKLLTRAEAERDQLEASSEELIKTLGKGRPETRSKSTLQALMKLFKELENKITRVAKLRVTLKQEAAKVREMNAWLSNEAVKFERGLESGRPPTPMTLASSNLFGFAQGTLLDPKVLKRRRLVEQFWSEVIAHQKIVQADQSDLSKYLQTIPDIVPEELPKHVNEKNSKPQHYTRKPRRKKAHRELPHD